jgi:predicted transcriptional regulator
MVIELQDGRYVVLEDNGELAFSEVQYQVISALQERGRMRVVQFREFVSVGRTQLDLALRSLVERGMVCRDVLKGTGAFEYYLPPEEELSQDV